MSDYSIYAKDSTGNVVEVLKPRIDERVTSLETRVTVVEAPVSTGSTTSRTLQDRFSDIINVKDYGAVGDGATDDTASIQAAIAAADAKNGGVVYFPAGTYLHSGLTLTDIRSVTLLGAGKGSFYGAGKGSYLVCNSATSNSISCTNCFGVTISGFVILVSELLTPSNSTAISLSSTNGGSGYCRINDVRFEHIYNGINIDGTSNSEVRDVYMNRITGSFGVQVLGTEKRIDQVRLENVGIDAVIGSETKNTTTNGFVFGSGANTIYVDQCFALRCKIGFWAKDNSFVIRYTDCDAENCASSGFVTELCELPWFDNCYAGLCGDNGFSFTSNFVSHAHVIAPDARNNTNFGMLINKCNAVTVLSPTMGGNGQSGISIASGVSNVSIHGGKIGGDGLLTGGTYQPYGIIVNSGNASNIRIDGVEVSLNNTPISFGATGGENSVTNCAGFKEEYWGTCTITSGNTTGAVQHGLGQTPAFFLATPTSANNKSFWSYVNDSQIIVALDSSYSNDITFNVWARRAY